MYAVHVLWNREQYCLHGSGGSVFDVKDSTVTTPLQDFFETNDQGGIKDGINRRAVSIARGNRQYVAEVQA